MTSTDETGQVIASPHDPAGAHVRARLDEQARELVAHHEGARVGSDPEHVHQMRVAVRRARAALKAAVVPGADTLDAELKWLGASLGAVRDFDVQLDHLRTQAATFDDDERAAVEHLLSGLITDRRAARRRMLGTLRTKRYQNAVRLLSEAARSQVTDAQAKDKPSALVDVIRKPHRKLMKAATGLADDAPDDDLHALRIHGKRLRYAAEMAAPAAKKKVRALVAATKHFQDLLGDHQDAVIAEEQIRRLLGELGDKVDADVAFVAGRLVEREHARKADRRARWRDAVADVDARAREVLAVGEK
ncbi:MAG: CHAD domain-containing protein [Actinomycetota bacterium]|nr:CHAD domain-containing protein [Actinomycetota bacterium]